MHIGSKANGYKISSNATNKELNSEYSMRINPLGATIIKVALGNNGIIDLFAIYIITCTCNVLC